MPVNAELTKSITDLIDNYIATGFPPAAAVAVYHGEKDVFELKVGRGLANIESKLHAGPEVIFELGSVTKVFTATLLALQPGIVSEPLSKHLPVAVKNPQLQNVTLKQLATHTSGFPRDVPGKSGPGKDGAEYLFQDQKPPDNSALVKFWNEWAPTNTPNYCAPCAVGTCWQYSNVGFVTLGYAAAGTQYNTRLLADITGPAQLNMPVHCCPGPGGRSQGPGLHAETGKGAAGRRRSRGPKIERA